MEYRGGDRVRPPRSCAPGPWSQIHGRPELPRRRTDAETTRARDLLPRAGARARARGVQGAAGRLARSRSGSSSSFPVQHGRSEIPGHRGPGERGRITALRAGAMALDGGEFEQTRAAGRQGPRVGPRSAQATRNLRSLARPGTRALGVSGSAQSHHPSWPRTVAIDSVQAPGKSSRLGFPA